MDAATRPTKGQFRIASENDVVRVRQVVRELATGEGFELGVTTIIVTAVSELARNVLVFAGAGVMRWKVIVQPNRTGLELTFEDNGPGIADLDLAMQRGYSSIRSLGMGLPGAKRLMDDFHIISKIGSGTTVTVCKWR